MMFYFICSVIVNVKNDLYLYIIRVYLVERRDVQKPHVVCMFVRYCNFSFYLLKLDTTPKELSFFILP